MTTGMIGLVLLIAGLAHRLKNVRGWDRKLFCALHRAASRFPGPGFFQEIWFLGRTSFALLCLIILTLIDWQLGITALAVLLAAAGLERAIKLEVGRQRPFQILEGVPNRQWKEPTDPSFPSGDALRVWYLAVVLPPVLASGNPWLLGAAGTAAGLVSLGRIVLGVHFPTDVLSGSGLGILFGSLTLAIWQTFQLL